MLERIKFFNSKSGLANYGAHSAFGNIFPRVVRNYSSSAGMRIVPNFVATLGMTVKCKPCFTLFTDNFTGIQGRNRGHISNGTGILVLNLVERTRADISVLGIGSLCSIQDSIILWATSSAISIVSAIVRPWAISPCKRELVAKYPPSSKGSMDIGIKYSDIASPQYKYSIRERMSQQGGWKTK